MPGDVEFLDLVRRNRTGSDGAARRSGASVASGYVRCAEEALQLLPGLTDLGERAAVCQIAETWLSLAETELGKHP